MRVFSCLVYIQNTKTWGDKFEERGKPCVFLGYPHGQKGYRVYDLIEENILTTRDVTFVESIFPFKTTDLAKPVNTWEDERIVDVDLPEQREDMRDPGHDTPDTFNNELNSLKVVPNSQEEGIDSG
ncbi:unnamed protein product [Cuscuta epithymum]|uniref:Retroviral polymerase SH3-like domain-containing protein n=1 Tax=Cuscuta epithymum TaxID=186058 RepID=A0AAV0G5J4_9ASTE|nr:unnamed protein product [Cuscuta epithymum]